MPINLAAITPHTPLLIPGVGKNNRLKLEKTLNSYSKISHYLDCQKIETIVLISPHGQIDDKKIILNASPEIKLNFEEFGDFSSKSQISNDLELSEKIRMSLWEEGKIKTENRPVTDFGSAVPLFILSEKNKKIETVIINISSDQATEHFKTGKLIGQSLEKSKKRIAVIASADLSHCLDKKSPAGFSPKGQKFDLRLMDLIHEKRIDDLLVMDEKTVNEAQTCGLNSIFTLFGILSGAGTDWDMATSTYEAPFGIGYLTACLEIKKQSSV